MATIQQSIEVGVPAHAAYHLLTQFERYPRFMEYVEAVHQLDATHLHWETSLPHRHLEWDSEITEQLPDRCIAWRNVSGPASSGKLELRPAGDDSVQVTLTMECDPQQFAPAPDGDADAELAQRIGQDLVRFKKLAETPGLHNIGDAADQTSGAAVGKTIGQTGTERRDASRTTAPADRSGLSENSLSQSSVDRDAEGQFNVAEEQSFDQQSAQARRVGQLPGGANDDRGPDPASALAQALQPEPVRPVPEPQQQQPPGARPDTSPG